MTTRLDLSWALKAVIPHADKLTHDLVVLESGNGLLHAYATNRYTFGIAQTMDEGFRFACNLSIAEATDLERFVRPSLVGQRTQEVILLHRDDELHVGYEGESAVFETKPQVFLSFEHLLGQVKMMRSLPAGRSHWVLNPDFGAKFEKAAQKGDPMHLWHFEVQNDDNPYAATLVAVGDNFLGGIAGLTFDRPTPNVWSWITEEKAA